MLQVILPEEQQHQIYLLYLDIARKAMETATAKLIGNKRYLNQRELKEYLSCGDDLVIKWRLQGLRSFKKGRETMYDLRDVHEFIEQLKK